MAFGVRAYWEIDNNHGVTDRIEIQEDGYGGGSIELQANSQGFRYRLSEITSESDDGLINPLANKIQVGKLTFYPKIESTAEETLLDDILGSPDNSFRIVWKQDGSVNWTGYVDNKKRSYPETGGFKFTEIRASDFELLKTIDYTLDDTRQTLITTIADLLGELDFGYDIRTATSWITEDTTDSTDFLSQIYHETKALREFARTGDESDQPISVWDALVSVGDPALLFRQVNGEFTVEQLTAFSDPENVSETLYDSDGVVDTATADVDRRLTGFTSTSSGNLVVKDGSQNDIYPGIKRAKVVFDHRTQVSGIELPSDIELVDSGTESFTQLFIGDGTQDISLSFDVYAETDISQASMDARFRILIDTYYLQDDGSWDTSTNSYYEVSLTKGKPLVGGGNVWRGSLNLLTDAIPDAADGTLTLQFAGATGDVDFANDTLYTALSFKINNPVASENSTTIHYQLTQSDGYSTNFTLNNTWFGDGPTGYSVSALRFGSGDGQVTADSWQRRGSVAYRSFHENLLKEILDLQRTNTRKLNAEFWGQYDPSKILVYGSQNFYCAGVSYTGVLGRWSANLFRVNVQTGSDTFEDIPKFTDETGSGSGSSSTGGTSGGLDQSTADARYLRQSLNGSDIDSASDFRDNIALGSTDDVTFGSATLGTDRFLIEDAGALGARFKKLKTDGTLAFDDVDDNRVLVWGGDNEFVFGPSQIHSSAEPKVIITRDIDNNGSGNAHGFVDESPIDRTGTIGYNSFDSKMEVSGTEDYDHIASFQARTKYESSGVIDRLTGYQCFQTTNGGLITRATSYEAREVDGSGSITDNIGFYVTEALSKGTNNWAFRSEGNTPSYFGGAVWGERFRLNKSGIAPQGLSIYAPSSGVMGFSANGTEVMDLSTSMINLKTDVTASNNLYVEGGLFVKEFVVDQTRVMYNFSMSPEGGKISTVTGSAGSEVITFEDEDGNAFVPVSEGSILRIQERTGLASGTIVKSLWRVVSDVTGNNITLSTTGITWTTGNDVGSIEVGDYAVQRGHTTDTDLDGRIDFNVSGVDMPYISIWDGSDDVSGGFEALRVGGMSGFDAGITGDVGIAGATSSDGAVFWVTEDEAKIAAFEFNNEYLTDGRNYIGLLDNVTQPSNGVLIGDLNGVDVVRIRQGGSTRIQLDAGGGAEGAIFRNASGTTVARFGSSNFLADLDIDGALTMGASGEITNSDGGYIIDADGIRMAGPEGSTSPQGFGLNWIGSESGDPVASISAQISTPNPGLNIESFSQIRFEIFSETAPEEMEIIGIDESTTSGNTDTGRITIRANGVSRHIKLYT